MKLLLHELKSLGALAAPLIAAQLSQCAMGFVDTVMAGRVSSLDLAAVAMGASIWWPVFLFVLGVLMAVTPSVAHLYGAGRQEEIGAHGRQALLLAFLLGLLAMPLLRHAGPLLVWLDVEPAAVPLTVAYLRAASWGMPAIALFFVLRHFSEGMGSTKPAMLVGFLGLAVNIVANYLLIFGKLGLPPLGGVGCGWATALTMWVMFLGMLAIVGRAPRFRAARLFSGRLRPDLLEIGAILRLGVPIGCSLFIEASIFAVIALLVGSLGADTVAAHQITLNFASLIFMVPLSIASAISVRVGHALGAGRPREARRSGYFGIGLTAAIAFGTLTCSLLFAPGIAAIYTDQAEVARIAVGLLTLGALFQVSDAIQVSTAGALRGYKDTRMPMLLVVVAYWVIGLPLGATLGLTDLFGAPMGAAGFWIGLIAGLSTAAILLSLRLRKVSRRHLVAAPASQPPEGVAEAV